METLLNLDTPVRKTPEPDENTPDFARSSVVREGREEAQGRQLLHGFGMIRRKIFRWGHRWQNI